MSVWFVEIQINRYWYRCSLAYGTIERAEKRLRKMEKGSLYRVSEYRSTR